MSLSETDCAYVGLCYPDSSHARVLNLDQLLSVQVHDNLLLIFPFRLTVYASCRSPFLPYFVSSSLFLLFILTFPYSSLFFFSLLPPTLCPFIIFFPLSFFCLHSSLSSFSGFCFLPSPILVLSSSFRILPSPQLLLFRLLLPNSPSPGFPPLSSPPIPLRHSPFFHSCSSRHFITILVTWDAVANGHLDFFSARRQED